MKQPDADEFLESSTGFLVNQLARLMTQALAQAIRPLELAPAQFPVLLLLWKRDGQTQRELLREVKVEQATLALTLNRMERDGLIVREVNADDSRSRHIFLTDKGRALREPALRIGREINKGALASLSLADQERFARHLRRAIASTREMLKTPEAED